ncbi:MAG: HNH endonuclease signature motif containing protein [Acidobacteriota bacterium]
MSTTTSRSITPSVLSPWLRAVNADAVACRLAAQSIQVLLPLSKVCAAVVRDESWRRAGAASLHDFTRERLERTSKWLRSHAALYGAVKRLPALRDAVTGADGGAPIGLCKAMLIEQVATDQTIAVWVARARRVTVSRLREAVRTAAHDPAAEGLRSIDEEARSRQGIESAAHGDDAEELPRVLWAMPAPPPVRAAFESALDLYRRVEGGDATVTSFIEALVAEEFASDKPPDVFQAWLHAADPPVDPVDPPSGMELPSIAVAVEMLATLEAVMLRAGSGTDTEMLWQLKCLAGAADMIERNLAALLIEMSDSGALRELGFASIGSYAEHRLGLTRTTIEDRVRVARALRGRRLLQQAYMDGAFGLEKALLVVQILGRGYVDAAREARWVSHLRSCTVKRLRDEKRALLRNSAVEGRAEAPLPLSDEAWSASLRCGPGDTAAAVRRAGHAACDDGPLVPVVGSMLRLRLPVELANDFSSCIESRRHHLALDAESCDWSQPVGSDELPSWRAARTFSSASRRLPAWVGLLALLEEFCAVYDVAEKRSASRSEVFVRSGHRCEAPGCTSRRVEWHHRHYKSRGGSDHHDNGDALCPMHHRRGQHGGYLHVSGDTPLQRVWRLGPAGSGTWYRNERRVVVIGR